MIVLLLSAALVIAIAPVKCDQLKQQAYSDVSLPSFQSWQTIGNFADPRKFHGSTLINKKLYVFGGFFSNSSASIFYSDVQFVSLNVTDGTIIPDSLSTSQSFSIGRSGLGVAYYNNYVYVVGGFTGATQLDDVQFGPVEENGQILSWTTSPFHLNIPRSYHRLEILQTGSGNAYLAAIAGSAQISNEFVPWDQVEVAQIYPNGSIGPWRTCLYHLKGGRSFFASNVIDDTLYAISGAGTFSLKEVFADVQFATIQNDGCPGPWSTSAHSLNMALYGHTSVMLNSNLFIVMGGYAGGGNVFNNVQYALLHTDDADTKSWTFDQNQFSLPRYGHSSVQLNDKFIYIIGGKDQQQGKDLNDIQMSVVNAANTNNV